MFECTLITWQFENVRWINKLSNGISHISRIIARCSKSIWKCQMNCIFRLWSYVIRDLCKRTNSAHLWIYSHYFHENDTQIHWNGWHENVIGINMYHQRQIRQSVCIAQSNIVIIVHYVNQLKNSRINEEIRFELLLSWGDSEREKNTLTIYVFSSDFKRLTNELNKSSFVSFGISKWLQLFSSLIV